MAVIFAADVYCDDCGRDIKNRICTELWNLSYGDKDTVTPDGVKVREFKHITELSGHLDSMDERDYDSDEYPKGCDDNEEADSPQHCGSHEECLDPTILNDGTKVGHFFGNDLTSVGDDYVKDTVREDRESGHNDSVACELWAPCYDYIDYGPEDFCAVCGTWTDLDENEECDECAE